MNKATLNVLGSLACILGGSILIYGLYDYNKKQRMALNGFGENQLAKDQSKFKLPKDVVVFNADGSEDCGCAGMKKDFNTNWQDALGVTSKKV